MKKSDKKVIDCTLEIPLILLPYKECAESKGKCDKCNVKTCEVWIADHGVGITNWSGLPE